MKHLERVLGITLAAVVLTGCGARENHGTEIRLNPDKPVSLTIWHYYNGAQQATFNALVEEFNATVGKERGIYVEGYSQGSVSDLEKAVTSAMKGGQSAGYFFLLRGYGIFCTAERADCRFISLFF